MSGGAMSADVKVQTARPRRTQACVHCRRQKMKCQFSVARDPPQCDRCHANGIECRFEIRANDKQWASGVEERLRRMEDAFNSLLEQLKASVVPALSVAPLAELDGDDLENSKRTRDDSDDFEHENGVLNRSAYSRIELYAQIGSEPGIGHLVDQRATPAVPKRRKVDDSELEAIISAVDGVECTTYFNEKLCKYLPILLFKYMEPFDGHALRVRSALLYLAVITVVSLHHHGFQTRHQRYRATFLEMAQAPEVLAVPRTGEVVDVYEVLDRVMALTIAAAWLGAQQGFKMSLLASELSGLVFPVVLTASTSMHNPQVTKQQKEMFSAVGLMAYFTEQRLRIIHGRAVGPEQFQAQGMGRNDFYCRTLAIYLHYHSPGSKPMDAAELKLRSNIELSTILLLQQQDLCTEFRLDMIDHWNRELDKWLAEWMGRLSLHLSPSSWKPVFLTFNFAKLVLNSLPLSGVSTKRDDAGTSAGIMSMWQSLIDGSTDPRTRRRIVERSERSAIDVLNMLIHDQDMERLIGIGPVFYPTIFITASALVLKLITMTGYHGYVSNQDYLFHLAEEAYLILNKRITSDVIPCYGSVRMLGRGIERIRVHMSGSVGGTQHPVPVAVTIPVPVPVQTAMPLEERPILIDQGQLGQMKTNPVPLLQRQLGMNGLSPSSPGEGAYANLPFEDLWTFTPYRTLAETAGGESAQLSRSNSTSSERFAVDAYSATILDSMSDFLAS